MVGGPETSPSTEEVGRAFTGPEVIDLLGLLDREQLNVWVEGGWGVDALTGAQHRDHGDLDLVVDLDEASAVQALLEQEGFVVQYEDPPTRVSLAHPDGRIVDLAKVSADHHGNRFLAHRANTLSSADYPQGCFTFGFIQGRKVRCLGPELQLRHHTTYGAEDVDYFDAEVLGRHFSLPLPPALLRSRTQNGAPQQ